MGRAAVVCYDLTNKATFQKVEFWIDELLTNEENCDIYIVGTKMDLLAEGKERGIPPSEVEEFARKIGEDAGTEGVSGVRGEKIGEDAGTEGVCGSGGEKIGEDA